MRLRSLKSFLADKCGNVAMMYALMLPVLIFGAGFAIDYTHAMQVQTKLDAAADAAVLAALTPAMMLQSNATAQTAAQNMFNAEASTIASLIPSKTVPTVTVCVPACTGLVRNVTVSYTAANTNIFAGILGYSALQVQGTSSATASAAANMNFYLLLDNSPSMALPATTTGIASMISATQLQDSGNGCAFACHQAATNNGDSNGNSCKTGSTLTNLSGYTASGNTLATTTKYCATTSSANCSDGSSPTKATLSGKTTYYYCALGQQIDNYQVARNNSIELRLDALSAGVGTLTTYAENFRTQQASPPTYKFAAYTMDSSWQIGMSATATPAYNNLMALTTSYTTGWTTASAQFGVMEYYSNNEECGTSACTTNGGGGDYATNYDNALGAMNTIMPNPGQGTNVAGDTPKEVLFFVTDGVEDENNAPSCSEPLSGTRCQSPIAASLCTTIKNRGIYIAILYTDYYPVTTNSWYDTWVEPYNQQAPNTSTISTDLQNCASPGMFIDAGIGSDLGAGLEALFSNVMAAHLTQ
jgi:Flp pilus assembly protein TadG